jgi:hypothetical protein
LVFAGGSGANPAASQQTSTQILSYTFTSPTRIPGRMPVTGTSRRYGMARKLDWELLKAGGVEGDMPECNRKTDSEQETMGRGSTIGGEVAL